MWRLNAPSFSVYYGQPTPSREPRAGDVVITKAKRLAELPGLGYEVIYAKNGIVLDADQGMNRDVGATLRFG